MHGDYCPTKKLDIKEWIKEQNLKPGDAAKCPYCRQIVKVPEAANPPPTAEGLLPKVRRPRRIGPERIVD